MTANQETTTQTLIDDYLLKQGSHFFMLNFNPENQEK